MPLESYPLDQESRYGEGVYEPAFSDSDPFMADLSAFRYTKGEVSRAGDALRGRIVQDANNEEEVRRIFDIANKWRETHAVPMRSIRQEMAHRLRDLGFPAAPVSRLKRMHSIRQKLRRLPGTLDRMQDLGGCRIILPSMAECVTLVESLRERSKNPICGRKNYIAQPKPDGYRSDHLIFRFDGQGSRRALDGRRIELQVRTQLQHAWATAVETAGLILQESLKDGSGNADWLRLFQLMSAEIAAAENCPIADGMPDRRARIRELRELDTRLKAVDTLEKVRMAGRYVEENIVKGNQVTFYLLIYDYSKGEVEVVPKFTPREGLQSYAESERADNLNESRTQNIVLVEASEINLLKAAYPNYFRDVSLFTTALKAAVKGQAPTELTLLQAPRVPYRPDAPGDPRSVRPKRYGDWTGQTKGKRRNKKKR